MYQHDVLSVFAAGNAAVNLCVAREGYEVGAWDALFDKLLGELDELAERICQVIQTRVPAYRNFAGDTLHAEVRLEVGQLLSSARGGRTALNADELAALAAVGEARAQQDIPVADVFHSWRLGTELTVGYAREVAQRLGIDDAEVLEFVQSALAWSDLGIVTIAEAHRNTDFALAHAERDRRAAFARRILSGTVPAAELGIHAQVYDLDLAAEYVAFRAHGASGVAMHQLQHALGLDDPHERGLWALVDGNIAGFAATVRSPNIDGIVGYGPPRRLDRLAESYHLASRALATAQACGLRGAHDFASLGLRAAVAADVDIGEGLRKRYLEPLGEGGSARELVTTLRVFLTCGSHVERTATQLMVHQNTVRYRLARFEELTGASLRDTEVLVEVWWVLQLSAMLL